MTDEERKGLLALVDKALRISVVEEGPKIVCEYEEDARYNYPERVGLIQTQLDKLRTLLIEKSK